MPPLVEVTRVYHFNAAHRLHNPARDDAWNRQTYGKCNNADGHGHNFKLEVTVRGVPQVATGWVIDLARLDELVDERVHEPFDHHNLNRTLELKISPVPTSEVFAVEIWNRLRDALPTGATLQRIKLWETPKNYFEYEGELAGTR